MTYTKITQAARVFMDQETGRRNYVSAEYKGIVPKRGDRVGMAEQPGLYEVVDVNMLMQTANLKSTDGQGHINRNIPWTTVKFQGSR